ncbi:hypothetical protein F511_26620 [Dorcoceras hygrometricum]|uniref:Uncharacterized protein n=1 Tax=Dorcoceras hygrometricum TaxID=472368 RepID=A0A2Z7BSY8_9LAMI|nr:hypothetical protein F511_26620 [Dorcoceras hygrometricum]
MSASRKIPTVHDDWIGEQQSRDLRLALDSLRLALPIDTSLEARSSELRNPEGPAYLLLEIFGFVILKLGEICSQAVRSVVPCRDCEALYVLSMDIEWHSCIHLEPDLQIRFDNLIGCHVVTGRLLSRARKVQRYRRSVISTGPDRKNDCKVLGAEESKKNWEDTDSDSSSSSSSSSDSEREEVHCLMANQSSEDAVFDFSNTEFTREDLITALNEMVQEYRKLSQTFEEVKAENMDLKNSSVEPRTVQLGKTDSLQIELSKLKTENDSLRLRSCELEAENERLNEVMSSWTKSSVSLSKLHEAQKPLNDKSFLGFNNCESSAGEASTQSNLVYEKFKKMSFVKASTDLGATESEKKSWYWLSKRGITRSSLARGVQRYHSHSRRSCLPSVIEEDKVRSKNRNRGVEIAGRRHVRRCPLFSRTRMRTTCALAAQGSSTRCAMVGRSLRTTLRDLAGHCCNAGRRLHALVLRCRTAHGAAARCTKRAMLGAAAVSPGRELSSDVAPLRRAVSRAAAMIFRGGGAAGRAPLRRVSGDVVTMS